MHYQYSTMFFFLVPANFANIRSSTYEDETPEQRRERIMSESRKISMPIRPVGRPRKGTAHAYKEAEMASRRSVPFTSSHNNVFDLEEEEIVQLEQRIHQPYQHQQARFDGTLQQSMNTRLVDTKGMEWNVANANVHNVL